MKKLSIVMAIILCISLLSGCSVDVTIRAESGESIAIPDGVESAIENIIANATSTTDTQSTDTQSTDTQSTDSTTSGTETSNSVETTSKQSTTKPSTKASTSGATKKSTTTSSSSVKSTITKTHVVEHTSVYITGISINKKPNKTTYVTGDKTFDPTGMVLNRHYSDGSSDTISGGFSILNFFTTTPGAKQVDVEYKHENGSVLYCKLDITVTKKPHGTPNYPQNFHHDLENEVLSLVNAARKNAGLGELKMDNGHMMNAADIRALEIVILYSHERPDHDKWDTVYDEEDTGYRVRAENLGKNNIPADGTSVAQGIFNAWMNSAAHKANIMEPTFTHVSIACLEYDGTYYWAQLFGAK